MEKTSWVKLSSVLGASLGSSSTVSSLGLCPVLKDFRIFFRYLACIVIVVQSR